MVERVTPALTYVLVAVVLLALTAVTVLVSYLPLGPYHAPVALAFAAVKAVLVVLFFMHVRYSGRLSRLVILVALVWFGILIIGVMDDYLTRNFLALPGH
jgi:cytochrome c oxidase subunit 4